jgi:hypothetical protein
MEHLVEILINSVNICFDYASILISWLQNGRIIPPEGSGIMAAIVLSTAIRGNIPETILTHVRRWHGGINDRYSNIYNLVTVIEAHQPAWTISPDLLRQLSKNYTELKELITRCRTGAASSMDREHRNVLLKSTVDLCVFEVKMWAHGAYAAGILTVEDIHTLGFLMPGENAGHRSRLKATKILAEVKVKVINGDLIRTTIDQAANKNAAQTAHGWPDGIRNAVIVITSVDEEKEVYRQLTTRLHNNITLHDVRGKQFLIKASFLKHIDDEPIFGNEVTFSMPLTTIDLLPNDRHHEDAHEAQSREIERLRRENEQLRAELMKAKT